MSLLSASSPGTPILSTLRSEAPPQTPDVVAGVVDPIAELVIPPSDGKVLRPGDPGFDDLLPFNLRTTSRPRAIAQCLTARAVSLAIQWARRFQIPFCAHAGGHSYEGFSSCSGLMVDVRKISEITIDKESQTARLGAGCLLGNVAVALFEQKFAIPTGSCRPVGVSGLTLGGGHGLTARKFGLTCDSLISAHVVDAGGEELDANANENPDLFWALRGGGGGNFGVVTEFLFRIHPLDRVIEFTITWPDETFRTAIIKTWQALAQSAPDELSFLLHVNGGQGNISHIGCNGLYLPKNATDTPKIEDLATILGPLLALGNPSFRPREMDYLEAVKVFAGDGDPNRVFFKAKSDYAVEAWSDEAIKAFITALRASASPIATIFEAYGGAINRLGEADTAFPHRGNTTFCLQYYLQWSSSASTNRNVAAIRTLYNAMRPYLPGHSYVNYIDADLQDYARAYYKDNLPRLQSVKKQYDPDNFFHFAQSIPLPETSLSANSSDTTGAVPQNLNLVFPARGVPGEAILVHYTLASDKLIVSYEVTTRDIHPPKVVGPEIYNGTVVELFICTTAKLGQAPRPYYEFEVSPYDQELQVLIDENGKFHEQWKTANFKHSVAVDSGGRGWNAEMEIPLKDLDWNGDPATIVGNAFAIIGTSGERRFYSAYLPQQQKPNFHQPSFFKPFPLIELQ